MREQVVTFQPQPVITQDNVTISIDTVFYFTITDPFRATYEVANLLLAVEQLTITTLRNVIGSLSLEEALTSRDKINSDLRIVLDEATERWGIRVNRIELKSIDPPGTIQEAMEKQMRAERDKRAAILQAEGAKQAQILTAEGQRRARSSRPRATSRRRCYGQQARRRRRARSSRPSTTATRHPTCSPTSTCRRCRRSPTAPGRRCSWCPPTRCRPWGRPRSARRSRRVRTRCAGRRERSALPATRPRRARRVGRVQRVAIVFWIVAALVALRHRGHDGVVRGALLRRRRPGRGARRGARRRAPAADRRLLGRLGGDARPRAGGSRGRCKRSPVVRSNVNSLVGRRGVVTVPITAATGRGQIRVGTEFWTARPYMDDRRTSRRERRWRCSASRA